MAYFKKTVEFINNQPSMKETKSDSGERDIPLIDQCFPFLSYYLTTLKTQYLFTSIKSGEWITQQSFKKMWESIIKKMNKKAVELEYDEFIDSLTPHIFRHNYATLLDKAGVPLKERQYLMGHASVVITMDTYTHPDTDNMKAPLLLDNYIKNTSNSLTPI